MKTRTRYEQKAQHLAHHIRRKAHLNEYMIVSEALFDPMVDKRHLEHIARNH